MGEQHLWQLKLGMTVCALKIAPHVSSPLTIIQFFWPCSCHYEWPPCSLGHSSPSGSIYTSTVKSVYSSATKHKKEWNVLKVSFAVAAAAVAAPPSSPQLCLQLSSFRSSPSFHFLPQLDLTE